MSSRFFLWYRPCGDGTADVHEDTPEVRARIDEERKGDHWFGNPEGAILHGGVVACAFRRKVHKLYNARVWLTTGKMVESGEAVETEVTVEWKELAS